MGLFDVFKKKAQEAVGGSPDEPAAAPPRTAAPAPARPAPQGPSFEWDGDVYPLPPGWSGLSMDDWFLKYEETKDRLGNADEEDLEPMNDEDGEPLDPAEVLLITKLGSGSTATATRRTFRCPSSKSSRRPRATTGLSRSG